MKNIIAILLWLLAAPALAATATLSAGGSCDYTATSIDAAGNITVTCVSAPPPVNPIPPVSSCPYPVTPQPQFAWGTLQARQYSGEIRAYPIPEPQFGRIVTITQGQQPSTPAGVVTEFYVSTCPGLIEKSGACYYTSTMVNNNTMNVYRSNPAAGACYAPSGQQYYLMVAWWYPACPFGSCGFSLQWVSNW